MPYRTFSKEDIEKFFKVYCSIGIVNRTSMPSVHLCAKKLQIARQTVINLRNRYNWEAKRLAQEQETEKQVAADAVSEQAKRIRNYKILETAGINFHGGRIVKGKLKMGVTELVTLSRHVQVLLGLPDSHEQHSGGIDLRIRCRDKHDRRTLLDEIQQDLDELKALDECAADDIDSVDIIEQEADGEAIDDEE